LTKTKATAKVFGEKTESFKKAMEKTRKWSKQYKTANEIPDDQIPESYDYRSLDGYNFLGPIRD